MNIPKGKLIVIEGGEGAGKNTQVDLLKASLGEERFVYVKDPATTEIGLKLREILLHEESLGVETEALMYLAARAQLVFEVIKPVLSEGKHVVANRFDLSTIAYQVHGRERESTHEAMRIMSAYSLAGVAPDLVVYLDCPPEEGLRRVTAREEQKLNKFEKFDITFHERVREGYKKHIGDYPNHLVVDATRSREEIHKDILQAVRRQIGVTESS